MADLDELERRLQQAIEGNTRAIEGLIRIGAELESLRDTIYMEVNDGDDGGL